MSREMLWRLATFDRQNLALANMERARKRERDGAVSEKLSQKLMDVVGDIKPRISTGELEDFASAAAALEAEVERLRTLEALVAEAGRVEFRNDLPGLYPLAVWLPGKPNVHPMTWGATLDTMNQHGGRVTPEMIAHALEKLREAVAEEDADDETH